MPGEKNECSLRSRIQAQRVEKANAYSTEQSEQNPVVILPSGDIILLVILRIEMLFTSILLPRGQNDSAQKEQKLFSSDAIGI